MNDCVRDGFCFLLRQAPCLVYLYDLMDGTLGCVNETANPEAPCSSPSPDF